MRAKLIYIFIFILGCTGNFNKSKQISKVNYNRQKSLLRDDCELVFVKYSIGANELNSKAKKLLAKIQIKSKLSIKEDIAVIMIVNTVDFCDSDSICLRMQKCNFVFELKQIFEDSYLGELRTKYSLCTRGSTLRFKELKMGYNGSPTNCSHFVLVENLKEKEKIIEIKKIEPSKICL